MTGDSSSGVAGTSSTWSASSAMSVSPSVATAITSAPRARTSWMFESIFG